MKCTDTKHAWHWRSFISYCRMTKIMEKETDGHTAHKKSLRLTTLRMTNIMEEEMDGHKACMGSLKLLHRRIKQTSPQWTVHAVNELFCCSPGIMGGYMNISCCPSRGMTGGIMYAEDVCRYAYTKTPELTSRTKTGKRYSLLRLGAIVSLPPESVS